MADSISQIMRVMEEDQVPTDWSRMTVQELIKNGSLELVQDGNHGGNYPKQDDFADAGIPLITGADIEVGTINLKSCKFLKPEAAAKLRIGFAKAGDVLLSHKGTMGKTAIVPAITTPYIILNPQLTLYRVSEDGILDRHFLKYFFDSAHFQSFLSRISAISTISTLSLGAQKQIEVPFPTKAKQCVIASVLGAFDDKIELNRRMNETLEAMARAIFKDWFVDFGPTRAKAKGRDPYLASEVWDLFPDALDDEDTPIGWRVGTVGDCFHLTMGQSPPGSTYNDDGEGLPFFQGRTDFGFRYPEKRKYCTAPTRIAEHDDTLVSVRAPVGDINMAWERSCAGRGIAAMRHKSGSRSFTYYSAWAIQQELMQYEHTGTVFGAINKKQFEALKTIEPPPKVVDLFEAYVGPMDERIRSDVAESRSLTATRDILLPKLMSGEIRLSNAENAVGQVT